MTGVNEARTLLITGSTRHGSTNSAALRTIHHLAPATTVLYEGLDRLPAFNPDHDRDPIDQAVADLRAHTEAADAVLFCTPEYAGTLPGAFKNLLDWTVGGGQLHRKPVAWINVAAPGRGHGAHATLATVLGYLDAEVIDSACRAVPVSRDAVGADGVVTDPAVREQLADVLAAVTAHLRTPR